MKKFLWITLAIFSLSVGSFYTAGALSVDNFSISNYEIKLELGRDAENRSTLRTTERITAEFPDFDQNRGIERAIPRQYDDHSTSLDIESVKKSDGSDWSYTTYDDGQGNTVVRIGDADVFVRGTQTYVITYTQRDVTRFYQDTSAQEFYWDTNGTEWRVPIERLSVELTVDEPLRSQLNGNVACYQGAFGSTDRCSLITSEGVYSTEASNLTARENITIALGFVPETFAEYQPTLFERFRVYWGILQALLVPVAVGLIAWVSYRYFRITNRSSELNPIAPEYIPPKDVSITTAARIAKKTKGSVMAAQLVDLAVRKYLVLSETSKKQFIGLTMLYHVGVVKPIDDLLAEEKEVLTDMFGHTPGPGEALNLMTLRNNTGFTRRLADNDSKFRKLVDDTYRFRARDPRLISWLRRLALWVFLASFVTFSPILLVAALIIFGMSFGARRLTDEGLALRRYLEGLKMYIEVAETERLKMLQSPEGAEKVAMLGIESSDTKQRVVLYERVLPYAILFGLEREWSKQLGAYYEQVGEQPSWYGSSSSFNAATFTSSMHALSVTTATYGTSTSSSTGGSSGGGSSGGGGGGGGGGGW